MLAGQLPETALGVQARGDATLVFCLSEPDENFLSKLTLPGAMPCDEDFFNSTRGTYGLSTASTLSSGSFYLYNWTASGLFLRREPDGNRVDSLRLVQNTGASGQSAAQLIANEKCSAALDETGEATSLQSISYSDTAWSLLFNCNSVFGSPPLRQALAEVARQYPGLRAVRTGHGAHPGRADRGRHRLPRRRRRPHPRPGRCCQPLPRGPAGNVQL